MGIESVGDCGWLPVGARGMARFVCRDALPRVDGECGCPRKGNQSSGLVCRPEGKEFK